MLVGTKQTRDYPAPSTSENKALPPLHHLSKNLSLFKGGIPPAREVIRVKSQTYVIPNNYAVTYLLCDTWITPRSSGELI